MQNQVAIYARVSTTENQEYERQISDLTSVINQHGYKDNQIETYAEKLSGYNKERPELAKLLSKAEDYKCIYVTEISRLGRNPSHTRQIIDELTEKGIPVYIQSIGQATIDKDGKRNAIMSIVLQVLMEFAHLEAEQTKSRMKSGKIQKVKEGGVHGANLAFGYKNEDKKLVIDDEEAAIIRMIFKSSKDGLGAELIAQQLNSMNIKTRRSKTLKEIKIWGTNLKKDASTLEWNYNVVHQILKNPIYCGKRKYKGETYNCPAIISEELFKEVNDGITKRTHKRDSIYTYLLKNLMYCGVCGKKYMGKYQDSRKASKVYFCTSSTRTKQCCNSSPYLLYTETVFYHLFLSNPIQDFIQNPDDIKLTLQSDLNKINLDIESQKKNKADKEAEQTRLIQLFTSGSFKDRIDTLNEMNEEIVIDLNSINSKIQLLMDRQLELKQSIANYTEETTSIDVLINAKNNRQELRNIFNQLIDKIIVNKINDTYTLLTCYLKINGVVLPDPLKIFINIKDASRNKKTSARQFKYITAHSLYNEPVYNDNILQNDTKDIEEDLNEMLKIIEQDNPIQLYWIRDIPEENWLMISDSDK